MEEVIKKLIAADKAARRKVEEAEKKSSDLAAEIALKKEESVLKIKEDFSRKLSEKKQRLNEELETNASDEKITAETLQIKAEMERLFKENRDKWVEEIFNSVIA